MSEDSHVSLAVAFDVPECHDTSPFKNKFYANSMQEPRNCFTMVLQPWETEFFAERDTPMLLASWHTSGRSRMNWKEL